MKLTWLGHACFLLETADGSLVLDPYAPGSVPGLELPELQADQVVCSHTHSDHSYAAGVRLTGRESTLKIRQIACWHDDRGGALRGENRITVIEAEGLRLAHLGDLGHLLSGEQRKALGRIDVLMLPVGGYYTIGAKEARQTAEAIGARLVLPMHYRGEGFGYEVIGPVEDFLALRGDVRRFDTNVLELHAPVEAMTAVLTCPVCPKNR